jgi:hypothetical protein
MTADGYYPRMVELLVAKTEGWGVSALVALMAGNPESKPLGAESLLVLIDSD